MSAKFRERTLQRLLTGLKFRIFIMPTFCSYLVFKPSEIDLVHALSATAGWSTRDISDPSRRYFFFDHGMRELSHTTSLRDLDIHCEGERNGRLLLLDSEQEDADNIIQLIFAANLILEGFPFVKRAPSSGFELPDDDADRQETFENIFRKDYHFQYFTFRETLSVAVAIAAKSWGK